MLHSKTQILNNVIYGFEFGYPTCCIKYFNVRQVNGQMFSDIQSGANENKKLFGTGFICCPDCNDKFSEEELVELINSNRLRLQNFPFQDDESLDIQKTQMLDTELINNFISEVISEVEQYIVLED